MAKRRLSKSDIKRLNAELADLFTNAVNDSSQLTLSKKDVVEEVTNELGRFLVVNNTPWLFSPAGEDSGSDGILLPHLKLLLEHPGLLPHVTVDMGAVRFVVNGADVMRPGVTAIAAEVKKGELVVVVDETHTKPLALGRALMDAQAMRAATGGKVVQSLHYVGDKVWKGL